MSVFGRIGHRTGADSAVRCAPHRIGPVAKQVSIEAQEPETGADEDPLPDAGALDPELPEPVEPEDGLLSERESVR